MKPLAPILVVLALLPTACADDSFDMQEGEVADDDLGEQLRAKYGVRPRRYGGYFNGSNEAELRFRQALVEATSFLGDRLRERAPGVDLWTAELALNFLAEGGVHLLDDGRVSDIDSFSALGADSLVDNVAALRPYLHPALLSLVDSGECRFQTTNEKGAPVTGIACMSIEQALYANAGIFAWSKVVAAEALAKRGAPMGSLPREAQVFWTTIFYNSGPTTGASILAKNGVDCWKSPWTKEDDPGSYVFVPKYNAAVRTASFEYLRIRVFEAPPPDTSVPSETACIWQTPIHEWPAAQDHADYLARTAEGGSGRFRGFAAEHADRDAAYVDVDEESWGGLCLRAAIDVGLEYMELCTYFDRGWDGALDAQQCIEPGVQLKLDVDAQWNDSGRWYFVVRNGAASEPCTEYQVSWSVTSDCD